MASPLVAGAAAVLLSLGLPPDQVVPRLQATASNRGAYDPIMGYGIPDLGAATEGLTAPAEPGAAPVPAPRKVTVTRRCRRAQAALRASIRRAVRARRAHRRHPTRASRRAFKGALRKRDAAQRAVRRRCR